MHTLVGSRLIRGDTSEPGSLKYYIKSFILKLDKQNTW